MISKTLFLLHVNNETSLIHETNVCLPSVNKTKIRGKMGKNKPIEDQFETEINHKF